MERIILMAPRLDAGEGSRGGHVIGHTSSGKPIYSKGNQHIHPGSGHAGALIHWSEKDHEEAAMHHSIAATMAEESGHKKKEKHHQEQSDFHFAEAKSLRKGP